MEGGMNVPRIFEAVLAHTQRHVYVLQDKIIYSNRYESRCETITNLEVSVIFCGV